MIAAQAKGPFRESKIYADVRATEGALSTGARNGPDLLLLFLLGSRDKVVQRQNVLNKTRNDLSHKRLIRRNAEKAYICSKKDKVFPWEDVEEHCHDAEVKGWRTTKKEFKKSSCAARQG